MSDALFEFSDAEKQVLEDLPGAVGVYQIIKGKIVPVYLPKKFRELFGYETEEQAMDSVRRDPYRYAHPDDAARIAECGYRFAREDAENDVIFRSRKQRHSEYHIIHSTGRHVWKNGTRLAYISYTDESRILNSDGEEGQHLSEAFSQKISLENDLHQNQFDDLTGLPMIGRFFQSAPVEIREIRKRGGIPVILWLDYSKLREYDALNGFERGDVLIRGLAWLIREQFGVRNTARFNSDYFVACTEREGLENRLRHVFQGAGKLNEGNSRPVAAGIYVMKEEETVLAAAIDRAKIACDSLEEPAHSSFAFFDQEMQDRARFRQYVLENFHTAMEQGWIQVYYQPVVRTVTGKLCGAEALCRWIDPVYGMISPGQFIPALEQEGRICELDFYMVEQVCRDGREIIQSGEKIVPVSVNLSRKDFRDPKLADRIEDLARKYEIPRELLNIEITESAFIRHPEQLEYHIRQFHELGFQVWMDDFGTAYSSLGSLKDLKFDELKIDMSFLSTSTDKARRILTSVVDMAKKIGIQTLAEGVETEAQYKFLKRIGCEKVQGYWFGKPMDKDSFGRHCRMRQMEAEPLRLRNYYDKVSRIDYQTDLPLCVIEDDGVRMRQLFTNEAYQKVLRRDHIPGIDVWLEEVNSDNNPIHAFHRQYANEQLRKLRGPQVITYPSGDHYMELTGNVVTHYEDCYIYAMNIRYIQLNTMSEYQRKAFYIQNIYYLCSDIAVLDLEKKTMYGLKSSDSALPIRSGGKNIDLIEGVNGYNEQFVYPPDQERFRLFYDPESLERRMRQNREQDLTGFFRSRTGEAEYRWKLHMIMPVPKTDFQQLLSITLPVAFDQETLREIRKEIGADGIQLSDEPLAEDDEITESLLWRNLEAYAQGMYFWKDKERRFKGASRSFLDYYGFRSPDEILGKTDEDMHWHVEPKAFRKDELDVLQHGRNVTLVQGKCIARGKQRAILASKMPIYRNGRIIGLLGTFFDEETMMRVLNERYQSVSVDSKTELLNTRGVSESLRDYLETLWTQNTEFALLQIFIPEYEAFQIRYGEDAGRILLHSVGDTLCRIFGKECSVGRLTGSYFAILTQDADPRHLQMAQASIREEIAKLRKAGEWSCALTAKVKVTVMNQKNASLEIYAKNLNHMLDGLGGALPDPGSA